MLERMKALEMQTMDAMVAESLNVIVDANYKIQRNANESVFSRAWVSRKPL